MSHDSTMLDREAVRSVIQQWNANRLDLFALSEPDENLLFHGVMRFYFQDAGQKVATKCIRVASDATVSDVIETLIEKFRPDMRMLSVPNYALYEVHANGEERRLNPDEKPLLVQLNWHIDDREGRFLLKNIDQKTTPIEQTDINFKRKLSKREKKEQKKKEKLAKLNSEGGMGNGYGPNGNNGFTNGVDGEQPVAGKLYTEIPETSFTRSISNPEAVMRRRRQQKLEKKLQQFRSRDGGPDTGGTLKIYGESICPDVPYKTLLLSIRDCSQAVVREMLTKYGLEKADAAQYCLVQVNSDGTEYILDDDECPLSILMNHPTSRGSIMFHVRRRPADSQPRRRKKKPLGAANGTNNISTDREGPVLVEVTHSGDGGKRIKLSSDPIEVGSANTNSLQLFGPSIQARHCLISLHEGVCTVTPLHADALTFVNGHHITQPTILHNGSVVMFGRVASYRFVDSPTDGRYNLALSQSQLDSACLYESRSPTSPGSWNDEDGALSSTHKSEYEHHQHSSSSNNNNNSSGGNTGGLGAGNGGFMENSLRDQVDSKYRSNDHSENNGSNSAYDGQSVEGNLENETKSISSLKSGGSNSQERSPKMPGVVGGAAGSVNDTQGQEPILPAVLEFPETHQELFLRQIISELDVNAPHFKLAPVYSLYLCARYRASTHYRPELQPTERAHKLTIFLHHVANLIYTVVQEQYSDPRVLAFWMANSSEFLHFLKSDRHISAFSKQAQEVLAESVQTAFRNLVNCFRLELSQTLNQFLSETIDHDSAAGLVLTVLGSAMALLRRCRVNAALTIQLFSQLFHYINVICFNTIVANSHMCTADWGKVMTERLQLLELWAERQGLELAADCHLAKINQCAQFLQAPKTSVEEIQQLACSCFKLNSLQMAALLQMEKIPRNLVDTAIRMAESVADELTRADGREVRLEESPELHLALLLPDDGFSCDVVRGIPSGLVDFLAPLQQQGMCRLAAQPTSIGLWTVYMHQFNARSSSAMSNKLSQPEVQIIKLHKNSNGMGLSIVAAKGAGQERLGIYIKSVVPGGAADADGRLQAGDQLLRVDGQSLIGITQERAADYLVRTGPIVTLEVAKQGAIYHGLSTLLQQPSPVIQRDPPTASLPPFYQDDLHHQQQRRHSSYHQQPNNLFLGSVSDDSLNRSRRESIAYLRSSSSPPMRRLSASCLQEELCARGHQLHIDPRYRDTRPIARSASSLYLSNDNNLNNNNFCTIQNSPMRKRANSHCITNTPPPSIFIEEYMDPIEREESGGFKKSSYESFQNFSYNEAHQPLNEDGIASVADSDEIPFIDDGSPTEENKPYVPPVVGKGTVNKSIISTQRKSPGATTYRKTVSFDLDETKEKRQEISSFSGRNATTSGFNRKFHTHDAISSICSSNRSSMESLDNENIPLIQKIRRELNSKKSNLKGITNEGYNSGSGSNSNKSSNESIERMPLLTSLALSSGLTGIRSSRRELNSNRSTSSGGLDGRNNRRSSSCSTNINFNNLPLCSTTTTASFYPTNTIVNSPTLCTRNFFDTPTPTPMPIPIPIPIPAPPVNISVCTNKSQFTTNNSKNLYNSIGKSSTTTTTISSTATTTTTTTTATTTIATKNPSFKCTTSATPLPSTTFANNTFVTIQVPTNNLYKFESSSETTTTLHTTTTTNPKKPLIEITNIAKASTESLSSSSNGSKMKRKDSKTSNSSKAFKARLSKSQANLLDLDLELDLDYDLDPDLDIGKEDSLSSDEGKDRFGKPFGCGKVREMASYLERYKTFDPRKILVPQMPSNGLSKSSSHLPDPIHLEEPMQTKKPKAVLSASEQCQILHQLKEWSVFGLEAKDFDIKIPKTPPESLTDSETMQRNEDFTSSSVRKNSTNVLTPYLEKSNPKCCRSSPQTKPFKDDFPIKCKHHHHCHHYHPEEPHNQELDQEQEKSKEPKHHRKHRKHHFHQETCNRRMSERDLTRMGNEVNKNNGPLMPNSNLPNSKSVPALHHHSGSGTISMVNSKSRSTHSLANTNTNTNNSSGNPHPNNNNEQGFYQNLSVYRAQNHQSQPILSERPPMPSHSGMNMYNGNSQHGGPNPLLSPINGTAPIQHQQSQSQHQQQQQQQQQQHVQNPNITSPLNSNVLPSRPVSAYYHSQSSTSNQNQGPQSQMPLQQQQFAHHAHNISASSSNLNGGGVGGAATSLMNQQHAHQQHLHQQHSGNHSPMMPHSSLTMGNRSKSSQNFNQQRMQHLMAAPSMPNINNMYHHKQQQQQQAAATASSMQHLPISQSMQNVNMTGSELAAAAGGMPYQNGFVGAEGGYVSQQSPLRRSLIRQDLHDNNLQQQQQQQQQHALHLQHQQNPMALPPKPGSLQQSPPKGQQAQQQQQHQQQQQQHLPAPAPKPQPTRLQQLQQHQSMYLQQQQQMQQQQQQQQNINNDEKPPLPPTATHPLYKASQQLTPGMNYVASTLDPPKGGYIPINSTASLQSQKTMMGTNPWEREEREKEFEVRREHFRQWREQQIADLSSMSQRTPQQEEQLKTLILERDFARRALETEEQEDESETSYEKENLQEVYRLANQNSTIQTPITNFRQTEIKMASVLDNINSNPSNITSNTNGNGSSNEISPLSSARSSAAGAAESYPNAPPPIPTNPPPATVTNTATTSSTATTVIQPKSILKNNRYDGSNTMPSSPSKSQKSTSFADDHQHQHQHQHSRHSSEHPISNLTKDISHLSLSASLSNANNNNISLMESSEDSVPPPPPPERNSSYLIMSQQKIRNSSIGLLKTATNNSANDAFLNNNISSSVATSSSASSSLKKASILGNTNNNNNNNNLMHSPNSPVGAIGLVGASGINSSNLAAAPSTAYVGSSVLDYSNANSLLRDNKRVSFHDEENNYVSGGNQQQLPQSTDYYSNDLQQQMSSDLNTIREDSTYLTNMDASMLPSMPSTPDAALWNTSVQSTPGVIGAQEVYRDPRQRRLAEKQQQQQQRTTDAVPEKLSFKEKMKMFALESGENNTPKDKLKISRAQRDIDAVH